MFVSRASRLDAGNEPYRLPVDLVLCIVDACSVIGIASATGIGFRLRTTCTTTRINSATTNAARIVKPTIKPIWLSPPSSTAIGVEATVVVEVEVDARERSGSAVEAEDDDIIIGMGIDIGIGIECRIIMWENITVADRVWELVVVVVVVLCGRIGLEFVVVVVSAVEIVAIGVADVVIGGRVELDILVGGPRVIGANG
jgi:hypothetical protein